MSQKLSRRKNSRKKKSHSKKTRINRKNTHVKKSRSRFNGIFGPSTEEKSILFPMFNAYDDDESSERICKDYHKHYKTPEWGNLEKCRANINEYIIKTIGKDHIGDNNKNKRTAFINEYIKEKEKTEKQEREKEIKECIKRQRDDDKEANIRVRTDSEYEYDLCR